LSFVSECNIQARVLPVLIEPVEITR
jgi:hypothetical protein